jgi:L-ascorbate metabolism protein UlaG (beta-lactamase superfamily)
MSKPPYYAGPVSDHFDGTCFFLPGQPTTARKGSLLTIAKLRFSGTRARWPKHFPSPHANAKPPERAPGLRITLVGHASFLIQIAGRNLLVDPVWSRRASPTQWLGPRRANPPGIALTDLPPIDAVLITHNHYDHMDLATIRRLWQAHRAPIIAPLGNDPILRAAHRDLPVTVMDWHDRHDLAPGLSVTLLPSQHWSARGLNDRRMALWGSFLFQIPGFSLLHIGDTAYGDGGTFRDIRARYGAPDLAIIPIGAYEPRWFMHTAHVNPAEAVQAMQDLGATQALGHHWGTFQLTDEPIEAPAQDLALALAAQSIPPERFLALRPGQAWVR